MIIWLVTSDIKTISCTCPFFPALVSAVPATVWWRWWMSGVLFNVQWSGPAGGDTERDSEEDIDQDSEQDTDQDRTQSRTQLRTGHRAGHMLKTADEGQQVKTAEPDAPSAPASSCFLLSHLFFFFLFPLFFIQRSISTWCLRWDWGCGENKITFSSFPLNTTNKRWPNQHCCSSKCNLIVMLTCWRRAVVGLNPTSCPPIVQRFLAPLS